MLYKVIINNKSIIVSSKRIKSIIEETTQEVIITTIDGREIDPSKFTREKRKLGFLNKNSKEECYESFRKHVCYLYKQDKIAKENYYTILKKAKELKQHNVKNYKKELKELL